MKRRGCILLTIALVAGSSGCASTARRGDGSSWFGPTAWKETQAPPQRAVNLSEARTIEATEPEARPSGLARYFPGLVRKTADTPRLAAKERPTWFSPRSPKAVGTTTYMTDARPQLNRPGPEPTILPVALQVPSERAASDSQVTPTNAETTVAPTADRLIDFGGKPSRPGEDEINPLPPARESSPAAPVADRMPEVPAVDPLTDPKSENLGPRPSASDVASSDESAVKASAATTEETPEKVATTPPEPAPPQEPAKPSTPTTQVVETSKTATTPQAPAPAPSQQKVKGVVLASPQSPPPVHTHVVKPTSMAKPSPQAGAVEEKTWRRPCLRRLVRKVCKLGEFADPPTAAPH